MKTIGVVGGVGPSAGLDLIQKVLDETIAYRDQDHISLVHISTASEIVDRTAFLLGEEDNNPAFAIFENIRQLEKLEVDVVGIPCNTAHAPRIFDEILHEMEKANLKIRLIHMLDEVMNFIHEYYPGVKKVGVLSTSGTYKERLYPERLEAMNIDVIALDEDDHKKIHQAIYDQEVGIKVQPHPVRAETRELILKIIYSFVNRGAQAIVLGCTEIPLAVPEHEIGEAVLIDPARILARALIREVEPKKLRAYANRMLKNSDTP